MLPNFLIIGAAKCGTTALYYYLNQHPEISFPKLKEPKFFSSAGETFPHNGVGDMSVDKYAVKSFKKYQKLFSKIKNKKVGEASPDSLYFHKRTAKLIKEKLGDIPIIIVLRNPVKRAFSAYMYFKRDSRETLSFLDGLRAEEKRLGDNWDYIWGYKKCGLYHQQVETFLNEFRNVQIILKEDLHEHPNKVLKQLFAFLDVDESFDVNSSIQHNMSGIPNNVFSRFLLSRNNICSTFIREVIKLIIPRFLLEKVAKKTLKKMTLSKQDEIYLTSYFLKDICKLEKLIKKDLSHWK